jgi:hypothetical protein
LSLIELGKEWDLHPIPFLNGGNNMHPLKKELSNLSKDELVRLSTVIMLPFIMGLDERDILAMSGLPGRFDKRCLLLAKSEAYKISMECSNEDEFKEKYSEYVKKVVKEE